MKNRSFIIRFVSCFVIYAILVMFTFPAVSYPQSLKEDLYRASALYKDGLQRFNVADFRGAIGQWEDALAIFKKHEVKQLIGAVTGALGSAYRNLGDYHKAISYLEQALASAEETGNKQLKGMPLDNLGLAHSDLGDYSKAIGYYEQAIAIFEEIGDKKGKGDSLGNLGNAYNALGDYRNAINYNEQALAIAEQIGDKRGKGTVLGNLGSAYYMLGDYRNAISYYEQALAIAEEIGDRKSKGATLGNMGNVYNSLGDYHKSIGYCEQAMTISGEIGDKKGKGDSLGNMGMIYYALGDYHKAINCHKQAISISKEIGVSYDVSEGNLGDVYLVMDSYEDAFAIYAKQDNPIRLGRFYLKKTEFLKAKEQFGRGREIDEQQKAAFFIIPRWIGLGLSYEGLKEYEKAYGWFTKAIGFMEDQRATMPPAERVHYFEGNEFGFPRIEAYEGAVRCAFMLGKHDEAFYWAENTRGRVLSELLSRRHAGENFKIPSALAQEEEELTTKISINKKQQQTAFQKNNPELLKQAEDQYPALKQRMGNLIDRLRKDIRNMQPSNTPNR